MLRPKTAAVWGGGFQSLLRISGKHFGCSFLMTVGILGFHIVLRLESAAFEPVALFLFCCLSRVICMPLKTLGRLLEILSNGTLYLGWLGMTFLMKSYGRCVLRIEVASLSSTIDVQSNN